ncbi:AMP-binding protein [Paraburkholderia sp. PGU19]|uniref:AMP-binding protein n=1 Tax=Paraburkholderia sp. PGU19 TaxID=2735434 RepID=UPI0015DA89DB|nr:AMP-binding protein [Paraburkholderia sp. PGU19]
MLDAGEVGTDYVLSQTAVGGVARRREQSAREEPVNIWLKTTSGTTDDVKTVSYSESFYFQQLFLPIRWFFYRANVAPNLDGVVVSINNSGRSGNWLFKDPAGWFGAIALLNIDERDPSSVFAALEIAEALRPTAVISKPPLFELFAEMGALERLQGAAFLVSSGAELDASLKHRLEWAIGCPVLNCYALSETSVVAIECPQGQGLHVTPCSSQVHLNSIIGTMGEIIITARADNAILVEDFHTGDFAKLCETPCSCGSQSARLMHLEGKRLPLFCLPDGSFLDPSRLNRTLPPILGTHRFKVHQTSATEFTIAMPPHAFRNAENSVDVAAALSGIFPRGCQLSFFLTQDLSKRTKFVRSFG